MNDSSLSLSGAFEKLNTKTRFQNVKVRFSLSKPLKKKPVPVANLFFVGPFICFSGADGIVKHVFFIDGYVARDGFEFTHNTAVVEPTQDGLDAHCYTFPSEADKALFVKSFYGAIATFKDFLGKISPAEMEQAFSEMDCMLGDMIVHEKCIGQMCNNTLLQFEFQVHANDEEMGVTCLFQADFTFKTLVCPVLTTPAPLNRTTPDGCCFKITNGNGVVAYCGVTDPNETMKWVLSIFTWNYLAGLGTTRASGTNKTASMTMAIEVEDVDIAVEAPPVVPETPSKIVTVIGSPPKMLETSPKNAGRIGSPNGCRSPVHEAKGPFEEKKKVIDLAEEQKKLDDELAVIREECEAIRKPRGYMVPVLSERVVLSPSFEDHTLGIQVDVALEWMDKFQDTTVSEFRKSHDRSLDELVESTCAILDRKQLKNISVVNQCAADFPDFKLAEIQKAEQPMRPLVTEVAQVLQEIQIQAEDKVRDGLHADRFCFLIAALFLNGFTDVSFRMAIMDLENKVEGIKDAWQVLKYHKRVTSQASKLAIWLINTNFLLPVLRAILRDDNWQSRYYDRTSYMYDDGTVEMLFYIMSPVMNVLEFDLTLRHNIIARATQEDRESFLETVPYRYLEFTTINPDLKGASLEDKVVEVTMSQFFNGKKYSWSFFSDFASKNAGIVNIYCRELCALIRGVKWTLDDPKKIEEVIRAGVHKGKMHVFFALMVMNVNLTKKHFAPDSSLRDLYRAACIISSLTRLMYKIVDPTGSRRRRAMGRPMPTAKSSDPLKQGS